MFWVKSKVMPFLRIEKKASGSYVRIVTTYREHGKVRQKTLYNLGKLEAYTPKALKAIGAKLYQAGGGKLEELLGQSVKETARYNYGYSLVLNKLLSHYGLDGLFTRLEGKHKLTFPLLNPILLMLVERLHDPVSKLSNYHNQGDYLGIDQVSLHHLYRSLDYLSDHKQLVEQYIYQTGRDLFNQRLDVVYYDVTTFYFDSEKEQQGTLRQKGFSKDGKMGKTQVLMGLLIDKQKQPVCYQVFKGDTFEGHTFKDSVAQLKERYQIDRVIIVADRGMLSSQNLAEVTNNGFEYIMGDRLKVLPEQVKQPLLNLANYEHQWIMNEQKNLVVRYHTVSYQDRLIIGTYSQLRAEKDKADRAERLAKAEIMLNNPQSIHKKALRYFLKSDSKGNWQLDEQKINQQARYDGFLAIATNVKNPDIATILDNYKHLFQIEHSFRTFKSYLETRPMFHWTDKRIEGHLCMCYIAYALLNHLQLRLKKLNTPQSEDTIRKNLSAMQVSLIEQGNQQFYLRSAETPGISQILKAAKVSNLADMTPI